MYKADARYPAELRFNEPFEKLVEKWNSDWTKTWNNYTQRFDFTAGSDLKNIDQTLRPLFSGAEVYPNLINQLLDLRLSFEKKKDFASAADASRLAAELYPQSDRATVFYAISLTLLGKKDEARTTLRKVVAINSKGIASPGAMNQIALAIAGADKLSAAISWLEISTEIYSTDANLFATLGDFYEKNGRPEQAIEVYKRALAIDPNFEKAKAALKRLPLN
jgi:tetratricopeptide (TPR) repeat protein